jgi:tetratricopeptide (TPR) repeat protein
MNAPAGFQASFEHARRLHAQGRLEEAERAYRSLAVPDGHREPVLRSLVELYMKSGRLQDTIETMIALTHEVPDRLYYFVRLAALLDSIGRPDQAVTHYLRLLQRQPEMANAHFNLALAYRRCRRYAEALSAYENAIRCGIANVEEVWSNMGVLYSELRRPEQAGEMYRRALAVNPDYVPALFNLAGLLEECGERQQSIEVYQRILATDPGHWASLARLAHSRRVGASEVSMPDRLRAALAKTGDDAMAKETLQFALGRVLDDLGRHDEAFAAYQAGNDLGRRRNPPYDRQAVETEIEALCNRQQQDWLQHNSTDLVDRPIFICGMFRSGSTLVEQILAAHGSVSAGGELDDLPWLLQEKFGAGLARLSSASAGDFREVGQRYLARLRELFGNAANVTDKRPDNFLRLGLIKAMFPRARIVYTRRNAADNCLSIWFQQLGGDLVYAANLGDTAHYYRQHLKVMQHWFACFGAEVFTVDYDSLVRTPEAVIRRLLEYLDLAWDERCLAFQDAARPVQTASVWQVRESLYSRSSGRWRHYAQFLDRGDFDDNGNLMP